MFGRIGAFAFDHRAAVLMFGALAAVLSVAVASGLQDVLQEGGFTDPGSESGRAQAVLKAELGRPAVPDLLLIVDAGGDIRETQTAVDHYRLYANVKESPVTDRTFSYWTLGDERFISDDGTRGLIVGSMVGSEAERRDAFELLEPALRSETFDVRAGGSVPAGIELNDAVVNDLRRAELIAFPVTFALLLLVFGGIVAASLPLAAGAVGIAISLAALTLLGRTTDVSIFAPSIVTMLGLGVTIDYSLFMVSRYREEMAANGDDVRAAVIRTVETAGRAVAFSGLTTALSLASLLLFRETFFRSLALGGVLTVIVAAVVAVLLLPAAIATLGVRARSPAHAGRRLSPRRMVRWMTGAAARSFDRFDRGSYRRRRAGLWYRLATIAQRRPLPIALVVIVVLLLAGLPFLRVTLRVPDERLLPASFEARQVADELAAGFSDLNGSPVQIVLSFQEPRALDRYEDIAAYADRLRAVPGVSSVESIDQITQEDAERIDTGTFGPEAAGILNVNDLRLSMAQLVNANIALVSVSLTADAQSNEARRVLQELREVPVPSGATRLIGGKTARLDDTISTLKAKAPLVGAYILVVVFVALFLQFRSVLLPLKAIVMNTASVAASLGVLVLVFQDGHLSNLLGFEDIGFITTIVPVMVFAIVFGISIDYEIFLLSRIREEYDETGDTASAVVFGLQRSGRVISGAAAVLIVVLGAFATSELVIMKQLGVGLAVAILVDVTLVRALLVPATMQLMRGANWWAPRRLQTMVERIGLGEA